MPIATPLPLAPEDIELLQRVGAASHSGPWAQAVFSLLLALCATTLFMVGRLDGAPSGLAWAMNLSALATLAVAIVLVWLDMRRDRATPQATRDAIARNRKFVVRGTLEQAAALPGGLLRYTIDGQVLDVVPVLALDTRRSHVAGRTLRSFTHLANAPVEVHCVQREPQAHLLLQTHYTATRPPTRTQRPAEAADRRRAGAGHRRFMGFVVLAAVLLVLAAAWAEGFDSGMSFFLAWYATVIVALVFAIGSLPAMLRARRFKILHTVNGPVTEIVVAPVPSGKRMVDASWYRVDGQLFPALDIETTAQLGNQVTVEFLGGARSHDGGRVVSLQRSMPCNHP